MFSIPHTFASEDENYITMPALRRFAKEKHKEDLKTTVDRSQLIKDIESYANQSEENKEIVLDWLDQVLIEGIKDTQIKYLEDNSFIDFLLNDTYIESILSPALVDSKYCHLCGHYTDTLRLYRYKLAFSYYLMHGIVIISICGRELKELFKTKGNLLELIERKAAEIMMDATTDLKAAGLYEI